MFFVCGVPPTLIVLCLLYFITTSDKQLDSVHLLLGLPLQSLSLALALAMLYRPMQVFRVYNIIFLMFCIKNVITLYFFGMRFWENVPKKNRILYPEIQAIQSHFKV